MSKPETITREAETSDIQNVIEWLNRRCDYGPPCGNCTYCRIARTIPFFDSSSNADTDTKDAIKYLESVNAPITEDRILWAKFLATQPSVEQIYLASSLVVEDRTRRVTPDISQLAREAESQILEFLRNHARAENGSLASIIERVFIGSDLYHGSLRRGR